MKNWKAREKKKKQDQFALKVGKAMIILFNYLIISAVILAIMLLTADVTKL